MLIHVLKGQLSEQGAHRPGRPPLGVGWLWTGGRIGWSCSLCDVRIAPEPPSTSGHAGLARTHSSDEGCGRWEVTSLRHASSSSLGGTTQRHTLAKGGTPQSQAAEEAASTPLANGLFHAKTRPHLMQHCCLLHCTSAASYFGRSVDTTKRYPTVGAALVSRRERVTAWWGWTFIAQRVCAPLDTVGR